VKTEFLELVIPTGNSIYTPKFDFSSVFLLGSELHMGQKSEDNEIFVW
jgi:hypothetical protein